MGKLISTETRIQSGKHPRVLIIGGGFGGLQLVKGLVGHGFQVVLFDRSNHHTFQPLLYQVATSAIHTNSIIYPFRKKFNSSPDFFFRMGEVTHIIPEESRVETSIGSVSYDFLVIAAGSRTNYFGNTEFPKYTVPLKTIEDATKLRNRIIRNFEYSLLTDDVRTMNSFIDYVIVGGGPTGVEVAGALAELKKHVFPRDYPELDISQMDIHLVEAADRLLSGMSPSSSQKSKEYLEKIGVKVHLNCKILSYDGLVAKFDKLEDIPTRTVIWGAGVEGNRIPGLDESCYGPSKRLVVNECHQVKGYENIFAIGDLSFMATKEYPRGLPMLAAPAIDQGKNLAWNLIYILNGHPPKPYKYNHKGSMATIGRNLAVAEIKSFKFTGFIAWAIWAFVHIMALVSFRSRFNVFVTWVVSYFSYDKSHRIIVGENFGPDVSEPPKQL